MRGALLDYAQEMEWKAWRSLCHHLKDRGLDVDLKENKSVVNAIILWGEELAELRKHHELEDDIDTLCEEAPLHSRTNRGTE